MSGELMMGGNSENNFQSRKDIWEQALTSATEGCGSVYRTRWVECDDTEFYTSDLCLKELEQLEGIYHFRTIGLKSDTVYTKGPYFRLRSTIICQFESELALVVESILQNPHLIVTSVVNRFKEADFNGNRYVLIFCCVHGNDKDSSNSSDVETCVVHLQLATIVAKAVEISYFSYTLQFSVFFDDCTLNKDNNPMLRWWLGNANGVSQWNNRWKVFKKLDQVSENVECLEDLMRLYFSGEGRVAKDVSRLQNFYRLFRFFGKKQSTETTSYITKCL
jgi:hypothetical protein